MFGERTLVVFEEEIPVLSPFSDESVGRMLLNLEVANRSEASTAGETIRLMLEYGARDGENDRALIKQVLLIAFHKRNHQKSQAEGEGSGEKAIFISILLSIIGLGKYDDLVLAVLPLVPVYGSWRDLLVLSEELALRETTSGSESQQSMHPVLGAICRLFAHQISEDESGLKKELAKESEAEVIESDTKNKPKRVKFSPSNAAKYVPHENRHNSNKKRKREETSEADANATATERSHEDLGGRGGRGRSGRGRGRGRGRGGRTSYTAPVTYRDASLNLETLTGEENVRRRHQANKRLALRIAQLYFAVDSSVDEHHLLANFRKVRVRLNSALTRLGYLVEPYLVKKEAAKINFYVANKGALSKYQKAIKKDSVAQSRWKRAMQRNLSAVPDIDSLLSVSAQCLKELLEQAESNTEGEQLLLSLQIKKAIIYLRERLTKMREQISVLKDTATLSEDAVKVDDATVAVIDDLHQIVMIDSCQAVDEASRLALLLSAILLAVVQESPFIVVDGQILHLTGDAVFEAAVASDSLGHWLVDFVRHFLSQAALDHKEAIFNRMKVGLETALRAHRKQYKGGKNSKCDVLCLCVHFAVYDEQSEEFQALLEQLQDSSADDSRSQLRTFRVHRVFGALSCDGEDAPHPLASPFVPREPNDRLSPLPTDPSQLTADVLFLVDFTGSMSGWMDTVKRELIALLDEIQSSSRLRHVRVALVGYRDFSDPGRVVTVDFKTQAQASEIVDELQRQHASGGGDIPEDLLSGLNAACNLDWNSHLRFCVLVTDAPAHGFVNDQGDTYPSGYCPDQIVADGYPTFAQCMDRLALRLEVDTFFCLVSSDVTSMRGTVNAMQRPYMEQLGGAGFGAVSLGRGDSNTEYFRKALVAQLTAAIAGSIVTKDLGGLQSYDGQTLSSICGSLLAPLRQTAKSEAVDVVAKTITAYASESETKKAAVESSTGEKSSKKEDLESDWQRFQRDMRQSSLYPVRLALGMPLYVAPATKAHSNGSTSLTALSCEALFRAGLTTQLLVEHNYPDQIVDTFQKHIAAKLAAIS